MDNSVHPYRNKVDTRRVPVNNPVMQYLQPVELELWRMLILEHMEAILEKMQETPKFFQNVNHLNAKHVGYLTSQVENITQKKKESIWVHAAILWSQH